MGSISKIFKSAVTAMSLGTIDLIKSPSGSKAATLAATMAANTAQNLAKERDDNSKKRVRLYATQNEGLGEEVNGVGISGNRGKIFS